MIRIMMMTIMTDDDHHGDEHGDYCIGISALTHLDYVKVWGKQLELSLSKFRTVQMPKEDQPVSCAFYIINVFFIISNCSVITMWHVGLSLELSSGCGGQACVTTLDKLFTYACFATRVHIY